MPRPIFGQTRGMVFNMLYRKLSEPWRQGIFPVVIGNTQRSLKADAANSGLMDLWKAECEFIVFEFEHDLGSFFQLPTPVFHLADHVKNCVVRGLFELS